MKKMLRSIATVLVTFAALVYPAINQPAPSNKSGIETATESSPLILQHAKSIFLPNSTAHADYDNHYSHSSHDSHSSHSSHYSSSY